MNAAFERHTRTILGSDSIVKYVTTLKYPVEPVGVDEARYKALQTFLDGIYSGVSNCGPKPFAKLEMYLDGDYWVIKLEAEDVVALR
jgi:hypothetical protein